MMGADTTPGGEHVATPICAETSNVPANKRIWDWDVNSEASTTNGAAVTYTDPIYASDWVP